MKTMWRPVMGRLVGVIVMAAVLVPAAPGASGAAIEFTKKTLSERFVAEGCAVADFDHDGHADVAAGNMIWHGPGFERKSEFTPPADNPSGPSKTPYDPARGYSDYFLAFAHDFTGDGWADILVYGLPGQPAHVFVNPQGKRPEGAAGHWEKRPIFAVADGESPDLLDITGDGRPELFVQSSGPELGGRLGFAEIDWQNPLGQARFRPITPRTPENDKKYFRYTHGSGAGDVNGDGRVDILTKDGWFEQPADISADVVWEFHPVAFGPPGGRGGAQMFVYDVNGDGRNDVITSYDGHGYGLGWFEQRADGTLLEHRILGSTAEESQAGVVFSQLHALALADIDGDGLKDIVTGKRRWAHGPEKDAEPNAPPVLYWFRLVRDGKGGAMFQPHLVDDDSGVGTQVTVAELDGDGRPDIVVANKRGVFTFTQRRPAAAGGAAAAAAVKRIVLVSGDEEYRSEEALPQLGRILSTHHGFECTVLYAIDPATGEIAPNEQKNIPGLEALRDADLMVIATRFRNLPDEQMKEIDDYLRAGRPVVGLRTATHGFAIPKDRAYAHYGNGYAGEKKEWADGFGRVVLGEKWINHHGKHKFESTRGVVAPGAASHPILRGIADGDIWGPTDVYGVRLPLPGDSQPLVLGQVLSGMTPDSPPVEGPKNDPMMPVAWTKTYAIEGGPRGRVFTTTMGSSTDMASEGLRRLVVNGCYWALGMEDRIPAKSCVDVVGTFDPTPYGNNGYRKGVKPGDL